MTTPQRTRSIASRTLPLLTACGKSHAAFDARCIPAEPLAFGSLIVALRSKYTRYSSVARLVSEAHRASRCSRHFLHRLLTAAVVLGAAVVSPPSAAMAAGGGRSATPAQLRPLAEDRGATGLGLALRKIGSGVSVLTIVAHPDDENNALHALLSRGLGSRVSLVSLTRGGGGQNEIGPELFDGLRILRTEELLTSHRLDAVEQYFGMVSDFGYSFSVEETLEKWDQEKTLGEVVRMLREFRPDVVFTLPPTGTGGGQHHQATGRLVHEAFDVAGDPDRFPEHAALGLLPWRPVRLLIGGVGGSPASGETRTVRLDTGVWDPLLGRTYADLGAEARSAHRCQGMGQVRGGPSGFPAVLVETRGAEDGTALGPEGTDGLFAGIPTGLERLEAFVAGTPEATVVTRRRLVSLREAVDKAANAYSATSPEDSLAGLRKALVAAHGLRRDTLPEGVTDESRAEIEHRMGLRTAQIQEAIALAHGLVVDAVADTGTAVPGGRFGAQVSVLGGPAETVTVTGIGIEGPGRLGSGYVTGRRGDPSPAGPPPPRARPPDRSRRPPARNELGPPAARGVRGLGGGERRPEPPALARRPRRGPLRPAVGGVVRPGGPAAPGHGAGFLRVRGRSRRDLDAGRVPLRSALGGDGKTEGGLGAAARLGRRLTGDRCLPPGAEPPPARRLGPVPRGGGGGVQRRAPGSRRVDRRPGEHSGRFLRPR